MRGAEYADLRAFAAVATERSFSRAAVKLGVSPSALSQTVRGLEERLGVRLLNRTTRSVATTDAGAQLLAQIAPLFTAFEQALADLERFRREPAGALRITAPRVAVMHFIAPRLGAFHRAYPEIEVEIAVEDALKDIVAGRFDAGIRLGERVEKDMIAVKISGDLEMMAVAAPEYLARRGAPRTPFDLYDHDCIRFRWPSGSDIYRWEFEKDGRTLETAVSGPLIVNDVDLMLEAALDGMGIAYMLDLQARTWVEEKRLRRVLVDWSPSFPGLHLYHSSRRQTPPPLRAFIDFLRASETP